MPRLAPVISSVFDMDFLSLAYAVGIFNG